MNALFKVKILCRVRLRFPLKFHFGLQSERLWRVETQRTLTNLRASSSLYTCRREVHVHTPLCALISGGTAKQPEYKSKEDLKQTTESDPTGRSDCDSLGR